MEKLQLSGGPPSRPPKHGQTDGQTTSDFLVLCALLVRDIWLGTFLAHPKARNGGMLFSSAYCAVGRCENDMTCCEAERADVFCTEATRTAEDLVRKGRGPFWMRDGLV
ncbi:hypothetical protein V2G26_006255 [Clonostachys chloroleuca]